jgi:hypothetical protein
LGDALGVRKPQNGPRPVLSDPTPPRIGSATGPPPAQPGPQHGTLRGRIILPGPLPDYAYKIYLFTEDGAVEGPKTFKNVEEFELVDLAPGRKGLVFFSEKGLHATAHQVVTVPAGGETEVVLRLQSGAELQGIVVDSAGAPVAGLLVITVESLSLPFDLYTKGPPRSVSSSGTMGGGSSARLRTGSSSEAVMTPGTQTYTHLSPNTGKISRGISTDAQGRFSIPISSATLPVTVKICKVLNDVLKEESVLPSPDGVRIVVPNR